MFSIGFTKDDLKRVAWTFLQAFVGGVVVAAGAVAAFPESWEATKALGAALAMAGIAAGLSAVKNLVLGDGSALK